MQLVVVGEDLELRDARSTDRTVVYFVQAEHGGPIKIGVARQASDGIKGRLSSLQTGNPHKLVMRRLVTWADDSHLRGTGLYHLEGMLHAHFHHYRLSGEWFAPGPDLVSLAWAVADEAAPPVDLLELAKQGAYEEGYEAGREAGAAEGEERVTKIVRAAIAPFHI